MKKILVGICGIGNGHINRQICVIKELLANNYEVVIATEKSAIEVLEKEFPSNKIIELNIPWIVCDSNGLNYSATLEKYNNIDLFKKFLEFGIEVENTFNGKPDLIISDYEPNVAQYAYSQQIPLITMEQQSKFMYLDEIKLADYSIKEEIYRLNYFFPKFDKKIISSFFPLDIVDEKIVQVPPIISKLHKKKTITDFIMVYLSPYSDSEKYEKLIEDLGKIKCKKFKVYGKNAIAYQKKYIYENVEFSEFNSIFKDDLTKCEALITTGGHQLISEAISINVPLYVIPLNTYEQNYNAYMVSKYKLGTNETLSLDNLHKFMNNIEFYTANILEYKSKYYIKEWEEIFIETIKDLVGRGKDND